MASLAGIGGIQKRPDRGPIQPKISPLIDRARNHRRNVPQLQMLSVTEFLKRRRSGQKAEGRKQKAESSKTPEPDPSQAAPTPVCCMLPSAFCFLPSAFCPLPSAFCLLS